MYKYQDRITGKWVDDKEDGFSYLNRYKGSSITGEYAAYELPVFPLPANQDAENSNVGLNVKPLWHNGSGSGSRYYSSVKPSSVKRTRKSKTLNVSKLIEAFAATEKSRPILTCICHREDVNQVAAADGIRLIVIDNASTNTDYKVGLTKTKKSPTNADTGIFPDFTAIIPRHYETIRVFVGDLLTAVNRAMVFAQDSANSVRFTSKIDLVTGLGELTITGKSAERGDCETVIEYSGNVEPFDVSLNGTYVQDLLVHFHDSDYMDIAFSGVNPNVFKPHTTDVNNASLYNDITAVIMPMSR